MNRRQHGQLGYSLVEILTVAGMIVAITGFALLNSTGLWINGRANAAMAQVLGQLRAARQQAISHRREVQVEFIGSNQIKLTEIAVVGVPPAPVTVSFEGGAQFAVVSGLPDTPMAFGNNSAVYFAGQGGGPPVMKFTTNGSFIDAGNTLVNGTVFLSIPGQPSSARAVTILGSTGRVREYHWDGQAWQE